MTKAFLDSNVLLYLLSGDARKADRAEQLVLARPCISVQVMNEFANVSRRKLGLSWREIAEVLATIEATCEVAPLTLATHKAALELADRYSVSFYDACIVASALQAECRTLWSEDMQDGLRMRGLQVRNPFR